MRQGVFYGVGVGPGDPELMTLKAARVLGEAGVIAVPKSSDGAESRALAIARGAVDMKGKELLELSFPMTRDSCVLEASRKTAASEIAGRLSSGLDTAFITLGDPLLYSTFSYLLPHLKGLLPSAVVRVIPGVMSFALAASVAALPLAETDERVIIIPAAYELGELRAAIEAADTAVLMKVNRAIDGIVDLLADMGLSDKAFMVTKAGWPDEALVTDIRTLKGRKLDYFSTMIIRKNG